MKFKVGDRVKFIKSIIGHADDVQVGKTYKIVYIDDSSAPYQVENLEWFKENELELATKTFTKSDLKDGDIVTYRNGDTRSVKGKYLYWKGSIANNLDNYTKELLDVDKKHNIDIVKVERPISYETIFERKEEILDNAEKNYLKGVIRPFRDKVKYITKFRANEDEYFIKISIYGDLAINLPNFEKGSMYKGMKEDKEYTLEELGL